MNFHIGFPQVAHKFFPTVNQSIPSIRYPWVTSHIYDSQIMVDPQFSVQTIPLIHISSNIIQKTT